LCYGRPKKENNYKTEVTHNKWVNHLTGGLKNDRKT
jgi:hypothetical protein